MQHHKLLSALLLAVLCLSIPAAARAQWTAGDYTVKRVITNVGNYVYSAGANGGYVSAVTPPANKDYSSIEVEFERTYTAPPGTPNKTITPKGTLTGSKSGGGVASSGVEAESGHIVKNTTMANPYNFTVSLGGIIITAPSSSPTIIGSAFVNKPGTGSADALVFFVD